MRPARLWLLVAVASAAVSHAEQANREVVYVSAVTQEGQVVPLYDKGFLIYQHQLNRLQVFRPDTQLAFDFELPCPGTGQCSATAVAVDGHATVAVGFSYGNEKGRAGGIRLLDLKGQPIRLIETSPYVPTNLCFDRHGDLWTLGYQRDSVEWNSETKEEYSLVRKFSPEGKLVGQFLPRSLWANRKSAPGSSGRGYWRMCAASDRIGVLIHESFADNPPEWVEWDLTGKLLSRTTLNDRWSAAGRAFLLAADGEDLVYKAYPGGNVRLLWVRPGVR